MRETIQFAFLGLGLGAMYALVSHGLIVIYRGSGVLNFAQGAMSMFGAYVFYEIRTAGSPFFVALLGAVLAAALLGALVHRLIMAHLERAAPITRVVATLGVLISLQAAATLRYRSDILQVPVDLPNSATTIFGAPVAVDRLLLVGIAAALALALWALYRHTAFGRATTAVAENQRNAASLGLSPHRIATVNWALGSALGALAAVLVSPIITLTPNVFTKLMIAALAVSLVASFRSFPIALFAGLALGVVETQLSLHSSITGISQSAPFLVIVVVLLVRGKALPLRDHLLQRLPAIGSGRVRWPVVVAAVAVMALIIPSVPSDWQDSLVVMFATGIILMSIVVVTGYAGQISLAQFALAGFGAWVAGRLAATQGVSFPVAIILGVVASVPAGVIFALPALRARGINLAIVTLGLGSVLELMLFNNGKVTGGYLGTQLPSLSIFGWSVDPVLHAARYSWVVLGAFVLVALMVANLRRSRSGRRLLAVRTNERAAAALGINVTGGKVYAFALSAAIAGLGGVLLSFRYSVINYSQFSTLTSISDVGFAVLGGVGYLLGPLWGATLAPGSIGVPFGNHVLSGISKYVELIGGLSIIVIVLQNQNGIAPQITSQLRWLWHHLPGTERLRRSAARPSEVLTDAEHERAVPKTLAVEGLTVKYGSVTAADGVNLVIEPGRVVGLIGPNGAGKTTVIDAITGFTEMSGGSVELDGKDISRAKVFARARAGVSRSFQSLELFEDSTVLENLRTAADPRDRMSYLRDLFWPVSPPLPTQAVAAIREFGLGEHLDKPAEDLSYGQRRLLAIARAVAAGPSVLLLDEPAAGLGDVETAELGSLVRRLADEWGIGVLVVEHDMNFVMNVCDELVVLDFGRQIASGPCDVVRRDPAVLSAYLGETPEEQEVDQAMDVASASGVLSDVEVLGERAPLGEPAHAQERGEVVLEARGLSVGYGPQAVVHDISLTARAGEVVVLLGANGAGKTTTLLALSGELPLLAGEVLVDEQVTHASLTRRARDGLAVVPEERSVFRSMTTMDNLRLGDADPSLALELFPELEKRLNLQAGMLSGGEQQMLALGRALSRRPKVLLADELSLGLAPLATERLLRAVQRSAKEHGTAVVLVEQHVRKALQYGDRGYVMRRGHIVVEGTALDLHHRIGEIEATYMSSASASPVEA